MWEIFATEYLGISAPLRLHGHHITGNGNGLIAAFVDALASAGHEVRVLDYSEHALTAGDDACAAAYVECRVDSRVLWGVGIDSSITAASLHAVLSAVHGANALS